MSPPAIRRMLIAAAAGVLGVGLFIAIAVMKPAVCYGSGMDSVCWFDRWRIAVGAGSAFIAIALLSLSIPDHGRTPDPDE